MNTTFRQGEIYQKYFMTNWIFYFIVNDWDSSQEIWLGCFISYITDIRVCLTPQIMKAMARPPAESWWNFLCFNVPNNQDMAELYVFQFSIFLSLRFFLSSRSNLTFSKIIAKTVRSEILKVTGRNKTGRDVFAILS